MDESCFYYGVQTAGGACSGLFDTKMQKKIIAISGGSQSIKNKVFATLSTELKKENRKNDVLHSLDNNIFGVYCENNGLLFADEKFFDNNGQKEICKKINLNKYFTQNIPQIFLDDYILEYDETAERCRKFLIASDGLKKEMLRIDSQNINYGAATSFSSKLWKKHGGKMKGSVGTETKRFVTCVTPDGVELNTKIFNQCDRIDVIVDKTGAVARFTVDRVRRYALSSGYEVLSLICSLDCKTVEHIIIPELGYGLISAKHFHHIEPKKSRRIFAAKFHTKGSELVKNRLAFTHKAYCSLMNEAFNLLALAKENEERLDRILCKNIDTQTVVGELKNLYKNPDL